MRYNLERITKMISLENSIAALCRIVNLRNYLHYYSFNSIRVAIEKSNSNYWKVLYKIWGHPSINGPLLD